MKRPSFQFYPGDWLHDIGVRACSLAARGLWMDMLSFMHQANPYGHLLLPSGGEDGGKDGGKDIFKAILPPILARMVGSTSEEVERLLAELEQAEVFSRTAEGVIFSRRMVQDEKAREARASGGVYSLKNPNVPRPKATQKDTLPGSLGGSLGISLGGSPSSSSSSSYKTSSSEPTGSDVVSTSAKENKSKPPSREACKLATLLKAEIRSNKADFRITQAQERKWEATADLMLRRDGRSYEEIAELIYWSQGDEFWRTNVLSMDTLRKQFDKLALKREAATNSGRKTPKATAIIGSAVENTLALLEGGVQ